MKTIRSGDLRHRIRFQRPAVTIDAEGDAVTLWTDAFTTWADVRPVVGQETLSGQQLHESADHTIAIRYRSTPIPPTWRVIWRDTALEIVGEPEDLAGRHTWLLLNCRTKIRGAADLMLGTVPPVGAVIFPRGYLVTTRGAVVVSSSAPPVGALLFDRGYLTTPRGPVVVTA